jgi:DNA-binding GntR family transcriptional regulator
MEPDDARGATMDQASKRSGGNVQRLYDSVKEMAAGYHFKPGERINEGALAKRLGVSRTPLREALNRLEGEGFVTFETGKGFFCRALDPKEVFDLYQLRVAIETTAVRLAATRIRESDIAELEDFLDTTGPDVDGRSSEALVALDEHFHERLIELSGNAEMLRVLRNINARIRFVRWIDMENRRVMTQSEHREVLAALKAGQTELCAERLRRHIEKRLDQITEAIKEGISRIYLPDIPRG